MERLSAEKVRAYCLQAGGFRDLVTGERRPWRDGCRSGGVRELLTEAGAFAASALLRAPVSLCGKGRHSTQQRGGGRSNHPAWSGGEREADWQCIIIFSLIGHGSPQDLTVRIMAAHPKPIFGPSGGRNPKHSRASRFVPASRAELCPSPFRSTQNLGALGGMG